MIEQSIPAIAACGSGSSKFSLPLAIATGLVYFEVAQPPEKLLWMQSEWMLLGVAVLLILEQSLNVIQNDSFRRHWTKVEHVLLAMTAMITVIALTRGLSKPEVLSVLAVSYGAAGIIKAGVFDRINEVLSKLQGG